MGQFEVSIHADKFYIEHRRAIAFGKIPTIPNVKVNVKNGNSFKTDKIKFYQ